VVKTSPSKSRKPAKRSSTGAPGPIPFWLVQLVLGLVLIAAGVLKFHQILFQAQDESTQTQLLMVFAEVEILGGVWMAGMFSPERTRWWFAAVFMGLACSSLFQALAGKCSCGCFGSLSINPWLVLVFDLAAVAALIWSRPPGKSRTGFPANPLHWAGLGAVAILVVVAGWRQADLVTVAGTATLDGRALEDATLTFTGESGKIDLRTDHEGHFQLPVVRPGLYAVSAPGRLSVPPTSPEVASRKAVKGTTQRSKQQPASATQTIGSEAVLWVEIPACSEYDKLIKL
jgi:hypothetical protein